jgi:hypothetical protein
MEIRLLSLIGVGVSFPPCLNSPNHSKLFIMCGLHKTYLSFVLSHVFTKHPVQKYPCSLIDTAFPG